MLEIAFSPLIPVSVLAALGAFTLAVAVVSVLIQRSVGSLVRACALGLLVLALAGPSVEHKNRIPLKDVAVLVVDRSGSQTLNGRDHQTATAQAEIKRRLDGLPNLETRVVEATGNGDGTRLFSALSEALNDIPPDRVAGAIFITDGIVHDIPAARTALGFDAPIHALITGHAQENDRRVRILDAPRFGFVGKEQTLRVEVVERGGTSPVPLIVRRDGEAIASPLATPGTPLSIPVTLDHAGQTVVEIEAKPMDNPELTLANNRAVVTLQGVRERLRVLLVSGEPHPGERVWRDLLKSDTNVDLVHFTILRPPEKQDGTPINQLSLIAFPTDELFQDKIHGFDLIILDRYANQSILPDAYYSNIAAYVRNGGALLIAAGPEFAGDNSLWQTPLRDVIPAQPSGPVVEDAYRPAVTALGARHPVTRGLSDTQEQARTWGEWLRIVPSQATKAASVVMSGAQNQPLLVLSHESKGRVALLLSDHVWLWARNFRGGGPYVALVRRMSHWLMKEPELEEEALRASAQGSTLTIERQTLLEQTDPVVVTKPDGTQSTLPLTPTEPGVFSTTLPTQEQGLYRITNGARTAFASVGPDNPREFADVFSTPEALRPLAESTGGSVRRIEATATGDAVVLPRIASLRGQSSLSGGDWIGLRARENSEVTGVFVVPLMTGGLGFLLLALPIAAIWIVESGWLRRARKRRDVADL